MYVCFGCKTTSFGFHVFLLWCVLGLEKSSKFERNIVPPYSRETITIAPQTLWVCFGCKIELSRLDVHFPCSRHVLVVSGPEKVIKTRLKHFSVVLMENGKNCTLIIVGMFQVQNGVIRARFSTSPTPGLFRWCLDREESSKLD